MSIRPAERGTPPAPTRQRWAAPAAGAAGFALVVVVVAVAALFGVAADPAADEAAQGEAVREYAAGIEQVARAAGSIVEFELKPALSRISEAGADHGLFAGSWPDDLRGLRIGLAEQTPPRGLEEVHEGLLDALDAYTALAVTLARAADETDPDDRERLLDEVVEQGRTSDATWDAAYARLQDHLDAVTPAPPAG